MAQHPSICNSSHILIVSVAFAVFNYASNQTVTDYESQLSGSWFSIVSSVCRFICRPTCAAHLLSEQGFSISTSANAQEFVHLEMFAWLLSFVLLQVCFVWLSAWQKHQNNKCGQTDRFIRSLKKNRVLLTAEGAD